MSILTWLLIVPLIAGTVVSLLPGRAAKSARFIALAIAGVQLVMTVVMAAQFDVARGGEQQFTQTNTWIPQLGTSYAVGVNGIGLSMLVLAAILVPLCMVALWNVIDDDQPNAQRRRAVFFGMLLFMQASMVGVFAARDVLLFYVFFEAMLIPTYFLIATSRSARAKAGAIKFLLFGFAGGLIMLVAVIALYVHGPGGEQAFLIESLVGKTNFSSLWIERWIFLGFFIAFAIKAPMWPVHTWLPDTAEEAPAGISVLLVGVLDKVGTFGMMTLCLPLFPEASKWATPAIMVLALVSLIYGGLVALGQKHLMRLIAFTSISHFGFIVMGIFAMTSSGQVGSMLYMVNHGLSTAALFLIAGYFIARRGDATIDAFGGMQRVTPLLAGGFLLAGLSSLALPGMSSFVSEFLVLTGTFTRYHYVAAIASIGLVLSALYILWTYQRMMTGPVRDELKETPDANWREIVAVAPIIALIVALGFFPQPVLNVLNPAVKNTMTIVGVTDPAALNATEANSQEGN